MGKEIFRVTTDPFSQPSYQSKRIYLRDMFAYVKLEENDSDAENKVDVVLGEQAIAFCSPNVSAPASEGVVRAEISGDYSDYIVNLETSIGTGGSVDISRSKLLATINRTSSPQTISGTIACIATVSDGTISQTKSFTLTVPPFKQRATNSNRRVTYTSGGVKYDLMNYM